LTGRRSATAREIDLLALEAGRGRLLVEKESNRLWEDDDLRDARASGLFADEDRVAAPDGAAEVTSPFPGCLQLGGALDTWSRYRAVGQTRHFVLFAPAAAG
jgi:hypothetical protein